MYAKVALLLLGFIEAVDGETCTCSGLKACVDGKKDTGQKNHDKCVARRYDNLPGNADQVQQCIKDKRDALEKLREDQVDCLLDPVGGACRAPRARRQTDPHNYFVQPSAGDFQPASHRGKWIQARVQTQASISASVDSDDLLKPYHNCVHKCLQELHPEKGGGLASGATQGAVDPLGRHLTAIQECQITEKCKLCASRTERTCSVSSRISSSASVDGSVALCKKPKQKCPACRTRTAGKARAGEAVKTPRLIVKKRIAA